MTDHLVLYPERLMPPETNRAVQNMEVSPSSGLAATLDAPASANCTSAVDSTVEKDQESTTVQEEEPLLHTVECRICQEEDSIKTLEIPCACSGSLKYAHRECVQRWCNEKGDVTCEICNEQFTPGYTAVPRAPPDETAIDISGGWTITGTHDSRLLAMATAQQHFLEAEYDEYASAEVNTAVFCRFAVLMLLALLLLRQALSITIVEDDADEDDVDASTYFSLFLLRAVGFLLPCYLMAWAINILQRRRQRQEEAALAATEVAFILHQAGQGRHLQFTISPDSLANPHEGTSHLSSSPVMA